VALSYHVPATGEQIRPRLRKFILNFIVTFALAVMTVCPFLQEYSKNEEILSMLKHVRPGNGFEPKFPLSVKVKVTSMLL